MNWQQIRDTLTAEIVSFGLRLVGALAIWILGRWLIALAVRLLSRALQRQDLDPTLTRYIGNAVNVALNIALVLALLGFFGVETTSFAALAAAMGVAIGAAWAGLLANVAAGAFLIVLRPFKVGDFVRAGGVEGTVQEVGIFATTILTADNISTFVGNNRIFSDTIQNFSASEYRRVDRQAQLAHGVDPHDAIRRLKVALAAVPHIVAEPPPMLEIVDFNERGPVLAIRPYARPEHYWQVFFDTNRVIAETFGAAGYPVPESHVRMHQSS